MSNDIDTVVMSNDILDRLTTLTGIDKLTVRANHGSAPLLPLLSLASAQEEIPE
jgi:hypothetical protein